MRNRLVASISGPLALGGLWCGLALAADFETYRGYGVGNAPAAVAAGDLDGDGRADLVVATRQSASASVLLADGAGGFVPEARVSADLWQRFVALADFDEDAALDL